MKIGLGLGLNKGNRLKYGAELFTNGDLSNGTTGYTASNATLSVVSEALRVADNGAYSCGYQEITTEIGKEYRLTFDIVAKEAADAIVSFGATQPSGATYGDNATAYSDTDSYERTFTATSTSTYVGLCSAGTYSADYDNISVREVL